MAFLAFTSAQMDANSPWDETVTQLIRTNFDDHELRLSAGSEALNDESIRTDFVGSAIDTDTWDTFTGAGSVTAQDQQPDHAIHLDSPTGNGAIIAATTKKARFDLDRDHSITMEFRFKQTAAATGDFIYGFQDAGVALAAAGNGDTSDMIGFIRGTNSNTIKFRTAKASTNTETDNLGNASAWQVVRITIASLTSGADITIRAYLGSTVASLSEISGSPFVDETKIPLVSMRPWFGVGAGGGDTETFIDYVLCYWTARPLSA